MGLKREMSNCGLLNNFTLTDPWLRQTEILRMAAINSARTLGLEDEIGSLEPGKRTDVILLDVNKPQFRPLNNVIGLLVYAATGQDVDTVIIDGKVLMKRGELPGVNEEEIMDEAEEARGSAWTSLTSRHSQRMSMSGPVFCWPRPSGFSCWKFGGTGSRDNRDGADPFPQVSAGLRDTDGASHSQACQ